MADAAEIVAVSYPVEDWQMAMWGHFWQVWNLHEVGRLDDAEREIRSYAALAKRMRQGSDMSASTAMGIALALLRGDLTEPDWFPALYDDHMGLSCRWLDPSFVSDWNKGDCRSFATCSPNAPSLQPLAMSSRSIYMYSCSLMLILAGRRRHSEY
jgi:hypothetical protein